MNRKSLLNLWRKSLVNKEIYLQLVYTTDAMGLSETVIGL
jgi:hypothetical protein